MNLDYAKILRQNVSDNGGGRFDFLDIAYAGKEFGNINSYSDKVILKVGSASVILNADNNFCLPKNAKYWRVDKKAEYRGKITIYQYQCFKGQSFEIFQEYLIPDEKVDECIFRALQELNIKKDITNLSGDDFSNVTRLASSYLCIVKAKLLNEDPSWYYKAQKFKNEVRFEKSLTVKLPKNRVEMPDIIMGELTVK